MKKHLWPLLVLCFLFIYGSASAQNDSGYLDLGRIKLRKDLTQHITIKGSDLEHMPFTRISDAIAPWLQGTITARPGLVYIVDGNLVNDADAWSIYDVEEITLVQNALIQVSGSQNNQQLILVTTKRKQPAAKGITVAGSSYLTNMDYGPNTVKSENNFYHQYHVGVWNNSGKIRYGASANWLRDVYPYSEDLLDINKPQQLSRFRFNGWADVTLAEGHTLALQLNVAPQTISYNIGSSATLYTQDEEIKSRSTTINPSLHLSNRIARDWLHELDLSYFTNRSPQDSRHTAVYLPPASGNFESKSHSVSKYSNILARDRISYTHAMGQWQLQPAVSISYRSAKAETDYRVETWSSGVPQSTMIATSKYDNESWVLTPAIHLSYGNAFNIGGGIAAKLKKNNTISDDKIYPFVTASLDLLRIGRADNQHSLKIFGSFAKSGDFTDTRFQQPDLQYSPDPIFGNFPGPVFGANVLFMPWPEDPTMQNIQAGALFSLPGDKLQVSYNFDNRRYPGNILVPLPIGAGYDYAIYHPDYLYSTHRLGVLARLIKKGYFRWLSGFNFTGLKYELKGEDFPSWDASTDANNDKRLWTGGFTNRLQFLGFSFGIDLLYEFNRYSLVGFGDEYDKFNAFRINNLYVGYSFKIANSNPLEVYLSTRNAMQSNKATFPDNRRYYGAGFKLAL